MPKEIMEPDNITDELLNRTLVVYSKLDGDVVKFKFRTKKTLYTVKVDQKLASSIEDKIKSKTNIEIIPQ